MPSSPDLLCLPVQAPWRCAPLADADDVRNAAQATPAAILQWRMLHIGGAQWVPHLLHAWAMWQADAQRPQRLHFTAVCRPEQVPSAAAPLQTGAFGALAPALQPLAQTLHAQCYGLLPGVHRLELVPGQLLLTLWLGDAAQLLRQQSMEADSITVHGGTWDAHTAKALARQCRRGTHLRANAADSALPVALQQAGFVLHAESNACSTAGLLHAHYAPRWQPRQRGESAALASPIRAGTALVVGAGLAGSAVAHSLAQRGWHVTVLAQGDAPADGASGLPAGLFCPHVSPDDSVLSRLSRSGVRMTLQRLQALCREGQDWGASGVLEHCTDGSTGLPPHAHHAPGHDWSRPASAAQLHAAGLPAGTQASWHAQAGWVRPAQLVQAQLAHPNLHVQCRRTVAALRAHPAAAPPPDSPAPHTTAAPYWQALDAHGHVLAQADIAIVACGPATPALVAAAQHWRLQAVRGQVTCGLHTADNAAALPPFPVNGSGNLVPHVPTPQGAAWVMGSTFERDVTELPITAADQARAHADNHTKLGTLLPASAAALAPWFAPHDARCTATWGQVRCTSHDRLPIAGPVPEAAPGLWVSTAMGARGLTLSVLCAELIAAQLHAEPWPLDAKLAQHLHTQRLARVQRAGAEG